MGLVLVDLFQPRITNCHCYLDDRHTVAKYAEGASALAASRSILARWENLAGLFHVRVPLLATLRHLVN
jgi:hypothetical protein